MNRHIKRFITVVAMLVATAAMAVAQNITVHSANGQNPSVFVNNHLAGEGVYIYNVRFNGSQSNISSGQLGTFDANGYVRLYMDSGVVMTTGKVAVAVGPNSEEGASNPANGMYGDSQMQSMVGNNYIYSCATLDFDFVSMSPFVTVNYCFGSEEYPEFVCSEYNDVFAFLITGTDPTTGQSRTWNMASIPHTESTANPMGIPVTINSVNSGSYSNNSGTGCYTNFSQYYVDNTTPTGNSGVQYDGFTQKLSANATIVPCEQYHMHISICNIGDNNYDSGVFLEHRSFNSPVGQINLSNGYTDTIVHSHPRTVPLSIFGTDYDYGLATLQFGGTALCGIDYWCISSNGDTLTPQNNTIDISDSGHTITFVGRPDRFIDQPKSIVVAIGTALCQAYPELTTPDTLRFTLVEDNIVALRDTVIRCAADTCREVGVEVAFGVPPLAFQWQPTTGIDHPNQQYSTACITQPTTYTVTATDNMGNSGSATVRVVTGAVGITQNQTIEAKVYPNPASERLNIEAANLMQVELLSANGTTVYSHSRCNGHSHTIDTSPYPAGNYVLRIVSQHGSTTRTIAIEHTK